MKIGFSLGRCIKDIVLDKVKFDDVLVIITGTRIPSVSALQTVIEDYMWRSDYLEGLDETVCLKVAMDLYTEGKLHQPRMYEARPLRVGSDYVWADIAPTGGLGNPMVEEAWQTYRALLGLVSNVPSIHTAEGHWKKSEYI